MKKYTTNGVSILKDGTPMTCDEVVDQLNHADKAYFKLINVLEYNETITKQLGEKYTANLLHTIKLMVERYFRR